MAVAAHLTGLEIDGIVSRASDIATDAAADRIDLYFQLLGGSLTLILIIIGFVGYNQLKDLKESISENMKKDIRNEILSSDVFINSVKATIEDEFLSSTKVQIQRLERLIDVGRMASLAEKIEESSSFNNADKLSLMQALINLKDDESISNTTEFGTSLQRAIASFHQAGLNDEMDEIHDNFSGRISQNIRMSAPMLEHYGLRCLSEQGFSDKDKEEQTRRMLFYIKSVGALRYPEISNQYHLAYTLWKDKKCALADRIIDATLLLTDSEISLFRDAVGRAAAPENMVRDGKVTPDILLFSEKFQAIKDTYPDFFDQTPH